MKKAASRDYSGSGEEERSAINSVAADASAPSFAVAVSQKTRKKNHGEGDDTHFDSDEDEDAATSESSQAKDIILAPRRRTKILPYEEIDERSKVRRIRAVAVDGADVFTAAEVARQSALARFESRLAAERQAARREKARVAELKRRRGEKWLPSMAKQMRRTS